MAVSMSANTASGGRWLFVAPEQGLTPVMASVSVNAAGLSPGTYEGTVTVTALGATTRTVPVSLTIPQGPTIGSITNAASFLPGPISPGEIVTIFGSGLGPEELVPAELDDAGLLAKVLAETRVYFDDLAAPLVHSSATQVSAIVPYAVDGRATVRVSVEYRGIRSSSAEANVDPASPAIFLNGPPQAAAINEDETINSVENGALPGSVIALYATGAGQTEPAGVDGQLATDVLPKPKASVEVRINGINATVIYAGAAPGFPAGAMQVNARIPEDVPRGVSVPVVLQVGDRTSPSDVTIFIRP
jgi:uncharacterized protein (TIGR03437 family)